MFQIFGVVVIILLIVLNKTYLCEAAPFPEEREDQPVGHFFVKFSKFYGGIGDTYLG